jgi:hypothetical protein
VQSHRTLPKNVILLSQYRITEDDSSEDSTNKEVDET